MSDFQLQPRDVTILRGRNSLPILERFVGLFPPEGEETLRIRFALGHGKLLDLPLSAEALADLAQPLSALRGFSPEKMPEGVAYLRNLDLISGP